MLNSELDTLFSLILLPSTLCTLTFHVNAMEIRRIFYVKSGLLWVENEDDLFQVDTDGNVTETTYSQGPCCVTKDGALLYQHTLDWDKYEPFVIKKKTIRGTSTLHGIEIANELLCIHSSNINRDILMLMKTRDATQPFGSELLPYIVARYNEYGVKIRDMTIDDWGQGQLYKYMPCYMTENRNGDIIISGGGMEAVVVMDSSGRHRFNYSDPENDDPQDVCTDKYGHILVAFDSCIHLLDEDGKLQRILIENNLRFLNSFRSLCLDDKQHLYVGTERGIINVYKYLKDD